MSSNRPIYHRILINIPCRVGQKARMYQRQVNISAGGVAFIVMAEIADHLIQSKNVNFSFEINQIYFQFDAEVVKRDDRNFKTIIALRFVNVDAKTRNTLDGIIDSLGGYLPDELSKKQKYIAKQSNTASPIEPEIIKKTPQKHHENEEDIDIVKLDNFFKEFNL
jgi:hypothetical protein